MYYYLLLLLYDLRNVSRRTYMMMCIVLLCEYECNTHKMTYILLYVPYVRKYAVFVGGYGL